MLHAAAGALRRRGLWLVFGALGGLIGGTLVAASTKPPVLARQYYKATAGMTLKTPSTTSTAVDPIRWSLLQAQLAVSSDSFRKRVASRTGVSRAYVKNHLLPIADQDTAVINLTVVTTNGPIAVDIASSAAKELDRSIIELVGQPGDQSAQKMESRIIDVQKLIEELQNELQDAQGWKRSEIAGSLNAARAELRRLHALSGGVTITPPTFELSSPPTAIQINSRAYFTRWAIASSDLGVARIRSSAATTAGSRGSPSTPGPSISRRALDDTKLPIPSNPPPIQPISLGILAGLVMGLSGIVLGEAWDDRVHDSLQARRSTGIRVIEEIPRLTRKSVRRLFDPTRPPGDDRVEDVRVRYREAALVIATDLGVSPGLDHGGTDHDERGALASPVGPGDARRAPVILVTSTTPSEGKTTSTAALASAFGGLGFRVLAVDGDYHHRSLRKLLRPTPSFVDPDEPTTTAVDGVWHLDDPESAGRHVTSSAIVARLVRRVEARRDRFDVILFDTPPVLTTADAVEYLQYADAAVLIVRIDQTPAPAAEHSANTLRRHGMKTPGVIVTDVPATVIDRYVEDDD